MAISSFELLQNNIKIMLHFALSFSLVSKIKEDLLLKMYCKKETFGKSGDQSYKNTESSFL